MFFKKSKSPKSADEAKHFAAKIQQQQEQQTLLKRDQHEIEQQINDLEGNLELAHEQLRQEKAGKRKIFHSLVKLANELKRTRQESVPLMEANQYANQPWYEGGIWRNQVQVLPGVGRATTTSSSGTTKGEQRHTTTRLRSTEAVSLSDLFFDLVIVTAFTRVGQAISTNQSINLETVLYFAVFWTIWSKEASYSSRFDTSDLSAKVETLLTCFAVLFGSLSASAPINSIGATRIMMVAAFCAILHCMLHIRVAIVFASDHSEQSIIVTTTLLQQQQQQQQQPQPRKSTVARAKDTRQHVQTYAIFNTIMTMVEAIVWIVGIVVLPVDSPYRWVVFLVGLLSALRVPRAFLANDFHAACSKRGVLFILLLGFLMQSIVVVASEFFEYDTPGWEEYSFIGACCLILFCIKLLYVEDSNTAAEDHALLVNRTAGFLFSIGQFCLLFSTTVMGSGLNLVTHEYLAATAALPGPSKRLVVGGFSAVVLSNFFIKSMHVKRIPSDNSRHRTMFVAAYVTEMVVTLAVVVVTALLGQGYGGPLQSVEENGTTLMFVLSAIALFLLLISWLDQGVELSLYDSAADSLEFRVQPFGLWSCCLESELTDEAALEEIVAEDMTLSSRLSAVSPLLGSSSAAFLREELRDTEGYGSMEKGMAEKV